MRVAAVQHDVVWEDRDANFTRLAPMIADAAARDAQLVLLTEMFPTGFTMAADRVAEPEGGPSATFLAEQAASHGLWVGGSIVERPVEGRPRNVFVLAGPGGELHRYAKIHPFTYGGEHHHYDAGIEVVTVDVAGVRTTPFVCYDLRFADRFWDAAPVTELYVVVANWPAARREHWTTLLRARAIENQAYVVGVNRVGSGGGLDYAGDSQIVDPFGVVLADAGAAEGVLVEEVDPTVVADVRARYPFLQDR